MASFQENEITEVWEEVLAKDKYRLMVQEIADSYPDQRSVLVDYSDIDYINPDIAMYILDEPDMCIKLGLNVIKASMPSNWDPKNRINLRINKLPRDFKVDVRKLRENHLGKLVAIEGMAKKISSVKPRMTYARFTCSRCGAEVWEPQSGMYMREPLMCPNPNGTCNKQTNRFILDNKRCHFIDTQKVEIQESPEGLRGGQQPEKISGFVEDDIAGIIVAGSRITINGIVRPEEKAERDKSTLFEIYLDIVSIEFEQHEYDEINITEEDEKRILEMSKEDDLYGKIVKSIAPTIYGMEEVKEAIALQLFGGSRKTMDDGGTVQRGDTHILLVGDPGVAKSQILRYMSNIAPRGIFASGKSATAAGLTAAAVKDDFMGDGFTLEAGALVLADKGLACIDELDKMSEQDTSSLHEAMESQKISIAKAGITATLQCRCSMLAAANPKSGRFDLEGMTLSDQIDLPPALISRFDLIFVLTDKPHEVNDRNIAQFILKVHRRGQALQHRDEDELDGVDLKTLREKTNNIKPYYDAEILRKYVAYSKRIVPIMSEEAAKLIENSYMDIRMSGGDSHSIPITARQLEAFIRLSEASAKMRLSNVVEREDAERAIKLVTHCLTKIAGQTGGGMDIDVIMSKSNNKQRQTQRIITGIISSAGKDGIHIDQLIEAAAAEGMNEGEVKTLLKKMESSAIIFSPKTDFYKVV